MRSAERRDTLLRLVRERGYINVAEAARVMEVDTSTIRRDLAYLRELGLVERSHGGAIPIRDEAEVPITQKVGRQVAEKEAVARAVARMVPDGAAVILDSGSTALMVARALGEHRDLTVITPDIRVANEILAHEGIRLIVPGGELVPDTSTVIGQEALDTIRRLHVDLAVMGADAVDAAGATNLSSVVVPFKRAVLAAAQTAILAVDSSKIGTRRLIRVATLDEFDHLVTDAGADNAEVAEYPVPVTLAPLSSEEDA